MRLRSAVADLRPGRPRTIASSGGAGGLPRLEGVRGGPAGAPRCPRLSSFSSARSKADFTGSPFVSQACVVALRTVGRVMPRLASSAAAVAMERSRTSRIRAAWRFRRRCLRSRTSPCPRAGTLSYHTQPGDGCGHYARITRSDRSWVTICHLDPGHDVDSGPVSAGALIGRDGQTGHRSRPHLHMNYRSADGTPLNPFSLWGGEAAMGREGFTFDAAGDPETCEEP